MTETIASTDAPRNGLLKVGAGDVLTGILTPLLVPLIDSIGGTPGDFRIALVAVPFAILKGGKSAIRIGEAGRRYTEAEGSRTGLVLKQGYRLIESLFGKELLSN